MKLWIGICILAAGTGSLIWGMFNLIDGNLIMGFAGLGVAFAIPIYLAATSHYDTPADLRSMKAENMQDAEFQSCNACHRTFADTEDCTTYHIMDYNTHIGMVSMHHRRECMARGLALLAEQSKEAGAHYIQAVHRIASEEFRYDVEFFGEFTFETESNGRVNKRTFAFLQRYIDDDGIAFVRFGNPDVKPRCEPKPHEKIPTLLPATHGLLVDSSPCRDGRRRQMRRDADSMMLRSMEVRPGDIQKCQILARHATDTCVSVMFGSGAMIGTP